jgi:DNA-binding transcriptional LysR family regulator
MLSPGTPTYDQLRIFLAVVETGSFAAAGRKLHRATSVISYGIANLEAQFGLLLFDREGTRKPVLTPAGKSVLAEAHAIAHDMDSLRAKVTGLMQGLEPEVSVAIDVMWPSAWLGSVLKAFAREFPTISLRLHVEALGAVNALVLDRRATIGISGPLSLRLDGIESIALGSVPLVPVAAPNHPLAKGKPKPGAGRAHVQLVLTDRSPLTEGRDFSVLSDRTWRLADLGAKHQLLREGIGWGNMPMPMIAPDLISGALVKLDMPDLIDTDYLFQGIYRADAPPGPAANWLLEQFAFAAEMSSAR